MSLNQLLEAMSHNITSLTGMEKFLGGLLVTAFSMSVVFAVLVILMGVIKAMDFILNKTEKRAEEKAGLTSSQTEIKEVVAPENSQASDGISEEEIAAVMAALSMMSQKGHRLVVRHIRRDAVAIPSWSRAAMNSSSKN